MARARHDMMSLFKKRRPVEAELTLADVIARGMTDNLDHRLSMMERTLEESRLALVEYDMLPSLAANAGYDWRNSYAASSSTSLQTGTQSLEPSYSSEKIKQNADLTFSWNVLDFGIGYYQAKQQADRVSVAIETRRRVMNTTTREIISAYYRAQSAEALLPQVNSAIASAEKALGASDKIRKDQLAPAQQMLTYKRDLLQYLRTLKSFEARLNRARQELATLINVPVDENFKIAKPKAGKLPSLPADLMKLQDHALLYRAELREETYKERIDRQFVHQETLKMFPALSAISSLNYDTNKYLYYNNWQELGLRASWNLVDVLKSRSARDIAKAQVEYTLMRRLALTTAVLAQTAISYYQYDEARSNYATAADLSDVEGKLLKAAKDAQAADTGSVLETVSQQTASIAARIESDLAYADAQTALAGLMVSIGYDLVPAGADDQDPAQLAQKIAPVLDALQSGDFSTLELETPVMAAADNAPEPKELAQTEVTVIAVPVDKVEREDITEQAVVDTGTAVSKIEPAAGNAAQAYERKALHDIEKPKALAMPSRRSEPVAETSVAPSAVPATTTAPQIPAGAQDCFIAARDVGDSDSFIYQLKKRFFSVELECAGKAKTDQ